MPGHLTFRDDATEEFLAAFEIHRSLTTANGERPQLRTAVNGIRSLALALEKACKDAVATIDPYLLINKLDRALVLQLRRDISAKPVPTIFCSRQPFETITASQAWETLRDLRGSTIAPEALSAFDQAFKRLVDFRNRATHGEIFAEPEELVAVVDEVLARFASVVRVANPDWFEALAVRNGQLESRLKAIESKVDANWQVLIDYVEKHGALDLPITLYGNVEQSANIVSVLLGSEGGATNSILGQAHVPREDATGLFISFLTKQQADARYDARRRPAQKRSKQTDLLEALGGTRLVVEKPLVPLDSGTLRITQGSGWLALYLEKISPGQLFLPVNIADLLVEFRDGSLPTGVVSGRLESVSSTGASVARTIAVSGTAILDSEWYIAADPNKNPPEAERTTRAFELSVRLAAGDS